MPLVSRREMLRRTAIGFGTIGLAGTMQAAGLLGAGCGRDEQRAPRGTHFAPRAKRVIYLFMNGGPSHVDTFDPKPALKDHEGEMPDRQHDAEEEGRLHAVAVRVRAAGPKRRRDERAVSEPGHAAPTTCA